MTITKDEAKALLDGATEGRRVQYHPSYCPEAEDTPFSDWDTSHDMSVILPDGTRYRLATYRHANDAAISQAAPDLARAFIASEEAREKAEERVQALEEALAFYADKTAWDQRPIKTREGFLSVEYENSASLVRRDRGTIARAALAGSQP